MSLRDSLGEQNGQFRRQTAWVDDEFQAKESPLLGGLMGASITRRDRASIAEVS